MNSILDNLSFFCIKKVKDVIGKGQYTSGVCYCTEN